MMSFRNAYQVAWFLIWRDIVVLLVILDPLEKSIIRLTSMLSGTSESSILPELMSACVVVPYATWWWRVWSQMLLKHQFRDFKVEARRLSDPSEPLRLSMWETFKLSILLTWRWEAAHWSLMLFLFFNSRYIITNPGNFLFGRNYVLWGLYLLVGLLFLPLGVRRVYSKQPRGFIIELSGTECIPSFVPSNSSVEKSSGTMPPEQDPVSARLHELANKIVRVTDDNLMSFSTRALDSPRQDPIAVGTSLLLGSVEMIEGREWIEATSPSGETLYLLGSSVRSRTVPSNGNEWAE